MLTLSYGYSQPENGDKGAIWFPAIAANMSRLNGHTHNGIDSALLDITALGKLSSSILTANWGTLTRGIYSQNITVPAQITEINNYLIKFYNTANGYQIHATWERLTATTYKVYLNDNTIALTAIYV